MPDERKRKVKSFVKVESCRQVDGSGTAPDIGVPLTGQFSPDLPIVREAVVGEEARRQVDDEDTEAVDGSKIISVGGPLSIVGGCDSEGVNFDEAAGRTDLISETEIALDTTGLPVF